MATTKVAAKAKKVGRGNGVQYTAELRREALRMVDGGRTMASVCEELGVTMSTLTHGS